MKKELASDVKWLNDHVPETCGPAMWEMVGTDEEGDDVIACVHFCPKTFRPMFARIGIFLELGWKLGSTYNYIYTGTRWMGVD